MSYRILTDSCCDLTADILSWLGVAAVPLTLTFAGKEWNDTHGQGIKALYDGLRAGQTASTSAINPTVWKKYMEPVLQEGEDLLVLAFSSGLSTTCQSAVIAAGELEKQYPGRSVKVVDTLCASMGQGLMVYYACQKRDEGLSLEELHAWCVENVPHLCHWFTVDDLMYLKRGGRVSAATALVGTMLGIKPVLHVDDEGHLVNVSKVRGRKASIDALAAKLRERLPGAETVFISHGDCLQDAEYLKEKIQKDYGITDIRIGYVGAVIGSHAGPGTLAMFYLGEKR